MLRQLNFMSFPKRKTDYILLDRADNDLAHVIDRNTPLLVTRLHLNRVSGKFTDPVFSYSAGRALSIPFYRSAKDKRFLPFIGKRKATEKRILWVLLRPKPGRITIDDKVQYQKGNNVVIEDVTTHVTLDHATPARDLKTLRAAVETLDAKPEPSPIPNTLLTELAQYNHAVKETADLLETRVLLYALHLSNFRETRRNLRRLSRQRANEGNEEAFQSFFADVNRRIAPLGVGRHGFRTIMQSVTVDEAMSPMLAMIRDIEAEGYPVFINSGTLLGYVRAGKPIPYDDDIDFAVYYGEVSPEEVVRRQAALRKKLAATYPVAWQGSKSFLAHKPEGSTYADLFPAWSEDGQLQVFPYLKGELAASAAVPVKPIDWDGAQLSVPADPEAILKVNYGSEWRVPDPLWEFDWVAARKRFRTYLANCAKVND